MTDGPARMRVLVEGTVADGDPVPLALIVGEPFGCSMLTDPKLVDFETQESGRPWQFEALVGALQAIAKGRHTGDDRNVLDFPEHCPTCGTVAYAQEVLETLGLQFAGQDAEAATPMAPSGMSAKLLHLVAVRGGLEPGAGGSILGRIAEEIGCTPERALQVVRQLERENRLVVERNPARRGNPVVKVRLA